MPEPFFCPLCNATVAAPPGGKAGQLIQCPRCEESFRLLADLADTHAPAAPTDSARVSEWAAPSNRKVALLVLAGMSLCALIALGYALWTVQTRRDHDSGLQRRSVKRPQQEDVAGQPVPLLPALDLAGLRYLPSDTDLIAGIQVAHILSEPGGKELLRLPVLGGTLESVLVNRLAELTGLRLEQLDHLVLGARLSGTLGRVQVIIRTTQAIDANLLRQKLGAKREREAGNRPVFGFEKELLPILRTGMLTLPDTRTVVLGWQVRPSEMPTEPVTTPLALKPELTQLLTERLKPTGPVWLAGTLTGLGKILQGLGLDKQIQGGEAQLLVQIQSFVLWGTLDEGGTLLGAIQGKDATASEAIERSVRDRLGAGPEAKMVRDETWLSLQYRFRRASP